MFILEVKEKKSGNTVWKHLYTSILIAYEFFKSQELSERYYSYTITKEKGE